MTPRALRSTGFAVLALSLLGVAGGVAWVLAALASDGEQAGVGLVLGGALALPSALCALLALTTVVTARRHRRLAAVTLGVASVVAGVLLLGLFSLFRPAPL